MTVTSTVLSRDLRMIVAMLEVWLINVSFMECTREFWSICLHQGTFDAGVPVVHEVMMIPLSSLQICKPNVGCL